jgi:L-alanine-DL-glutamate epimerase-like enolase superfamily enzyme
LLKLMPAGAARNAVDCALWSLAGDAPPPPGLIVTALTVGIDTPDAMARAAAGMAPAPLIKCKVDAEDPAARIRAVRQAAPDARLIVDPNESWDRALLTAMVPVLSEARVALIEQPVPAGTDGWLAGFDVGVPVCADESFHGLDDLDVVASRYTHVNIKLDKTGGLTAALDVAAAARARGLGLMVGCMISSSLSIAPALRIADMCDFVDLDGPLWLADDRPGGVHVRAGLMRGPTHCWS